MVSVLGVRNFQKKILFHISLSAKTNPFREKAFLRFLILRKHCDELCKYTYYLKSTFDFEIKYQFWIDSRLVYNLAEVWYDDLYVT